jgi:Holliday junction DNA helicase RuvA
MITFLEGTVAEALPTQVVVDVHGVGYEVLIPLSSFDKLPPTGRPVKILTHLQVREDAHILYGFMTHAERDLFRLLVNHVSGIGPKLAMAVLAGMSISSFKAAVVNGDTGLIAKISGIGKKTAERIVLELKDKVGVAAAWEAASAAHAPSPEEVKINDAVLALIALGYKQVDAYKAVKQALAAANATGGVTAGSTPSVEDLVRQSLKLLIQ